MIFASMIACSCGGCTGSTGAKAVRAPWQSFRIVRQTCHALPLNSRRGSMRLCQSSGFASPSLNSRASEYWYPLPLPPCCPPACVSARKESHATIVSCRCSQVGVSANALDGMDGGGELIARIVVPIAAWMIMSTSCSLCCSYLASAPAPAPAPAPSRIMPCSCSHLLLLLLLLLLLILVSCSCSCSCCSGSASLCALLAPIP